jgi:hypothetical protein
VGGVIGGLATLALLALAVILLLKKRKQNQTTPFHGAEPELVNSNQSSAFLPPAASQIHSSETLKPAIVEQVSPVLAPYRMSNSAPTGQYITQPVPFGNTGLQYTQQAHTYQAEVPHQHSMSTAPLPVELESPYGSPPGSPPPQYRNLGPNANRP